MLLLHCILLPCVQFEHDLAMAQLVLGSDLEALGGPVAHSGGWLRASDDAHCGKMVALRVRAVCACCCQRS
jgi:hypothetical protein